MDPLLQRILETTTFHGAFDTVRAASGLGPYEFETVVRYLELRHAVWRRSIAGVVHISPTLEMMRLLRGARNDEGFAAIAFHTEDRPIDLAAPLSTEPRILEALDVFARAGRPDKRSAPNMLTGDEQLELCDDATLEAEEEARQAEDDETPDEDLSWRDRESVMGEMFEVLAERLGRSRWKEERSKLGALMQDATSALCGREDAWGDDAYLDLCLVVYGRILDGKPGRSLPEAILRAYRAGTWPRGFRGAYPRGVILCVPFQ